MNYSVIITPAVEKQVYDCALYIARDNPIRAMTWADEVIDLMKGLSEFPDAHSIDPKLTEQAGRTIRHRSFGEYSIYYEVDKQDRAVIMHLFVHAKRQR